MSLVSRAIEYDEIEIQIKLREFGISDRTMVNEETFQLLLFDIFKENEQTTTDFDITEEELKMVDKEIEQKLDFEDKKQPIQESPNKLGSATRAHDDVMEFVDPFNEIEEQNEEYESRKEVTNMPLNNADFDSNPYSSKGYSTRPLNNSKNHLMSKGGKESMTKYCDPYSDVQGDENQTLAKSATRKGLKPTSKGTKNTEGEPIGKIETKKKDEERMY